MRSGPPGANANTHVSGTRGFSQNVKESGAPETIRTSDLQLRRLPLYPAELRARLALA